MIAYYHCYFAGLKMTLFVQKGICPKKYLSKSADTVTNGSTEGAHNMFLVVNSSGVIFRHISVFCVAYGSNKFK